MAAYKSMSQEKNCIQWVIDVFGHRHLIRVATVTEHNKTENPINSPPGAVVMVFVYCQRDLMSGFSYAGGHCIY